MYALATFFGQIPLYSIACARYIQAIVPGLSETAFAAGLITFFCVINVIGIRPAARLQAVMVLVLLSALLFFSIKGLAAPDPERFDQMFQKGAGNLFLGMALLTFTYLGSNGIIELGQEIRAPGKVIPRAYFIAFPIITVIYLLVALAVVNAVSWQSLADVREPLIEIGKITMGRAGMIYFVLGGAVLALATTLNGLFIMATKSLMAITDDGLLPKGLGRINKRFGTAHRLFLAIWVASMVGVFSGMALETFACYAALGGIIIFIPVLMASLALPRLYPEQYRNSVFKLTGFWRWFCPAVGIVMGLFFCLVIIVDLKETAKVLPFLLFILSGIVFYELRRRYLLTEKRD